MKIDTYSTARSWRCIILAAGQGTRMRSSQPKVLHPLLGRPLIEYSLQTARQATGQEPVVIIGHGADLVRQAVGDAGVCLVQEPQLGTSHAIMQAEAALRGQAHVERHGNVQRVPTRAVLAAWGLIPEAVFARAQVERRGALAQPKDAGFGRQGCNQPPAVAIRQGRRFLAQ